ncbi:MAG TPA: response regulator transcription factor [Pseudonocardiaceae bacterium]|nr:response regulator transcription factor [Pseudonocardiaceae bacterium]
MTLRRVLLVDDHQMLTEALAARLATSTDLCVAGRCATDDPQLCEMIRALRPDVVTIEVAALGNDIEEVLRAVVRAWPATNVVALSAEHDADRALRAARAGVAAWVPKECGAQDLATVLHGVCLGHSWYPPDLLGAVLRGLRTDIQQATDRTGPLDMLSPREMDVLVSMVDGRHGQQIAEHLSISVDTVRTHTRSILAKLGVHSRLEAVRVARAAGLRAEARVADQPVRMISSVIQRSHR